MDLDVPDKNPQDEQFFQAILDSAVDAIIVINSRGTVLKFNQGAEALFGYMAEEVIGNPVNLLMPEPHATDHDSYLENYRNSGVAKILGIGREVEALRKDGTKFPARLAVNEVQLQRGTYYTGILHEIVRVKETQSALPNLNRELEDAVELRTEELQSLVNRLLSTNKKLEHEVAEREAAESALEVSRKKLEKGLEQEKELGKLKSRFVTTASHEFRTPLSTILSSAALIEKYQQLNQQDSHQKHVDRIKTSVSTLTEILNDFVTVSKLEEGRISMQFTTYSVAELCQEVCEEVSGLLRPGQEIILENHPAEAEIETDRKGFKIVLFNLLSNAINFSTEGQPIYCRFRIDGDGAVFSIEDRGIGIPANEQRYLFDRFFRATNASEIKGTGLGLNIVRGYIEKLNGRIEFESTPGGGTTFHVRLPIKHKAVK